MEDKIDFNENILDVFRLIATVQVFLGHVISHFTMDNTPVNIIYFVRGVPILFVLCGFLAAKSLEKSSIKTWFFGRVVRIIPGFWACIIINTIIILMLYERKPTPLEGLVYVVTQFGGLNFFTGGWLRGYGCGVPNGVLWTIPVQIQFFLLVPLLHQRLKKTNICGGAMFVAALTATSVLLQRCASFLPEIVNKLIGVTVIPYLYFLVAGMLAWYHRESIIPALRRNKWGCLSAYVIWKLMEDHWDFPHVFDGVLYNTITTLLMVAIVFSFAFIGNWRMKKDLTYGFYLYHMVFINLALHLGFTSLAPLWQGILLLLVVVVMTMLCAWLSEHFVERPAATFLKEKGYLNG